LANWVMCGELTFKVDVMEGLDSASAALDKLFTGVNTSNRLMRP